MERHRVAIRERLAKSGPGNTGWQRDLSVSYEKIGGVHEAQGDLKAALKSYSNEIAIAERLAQSDPDGGKKALRASSTRFAVKSLISAGIS